MHARGLFSEAQLKLNCDVRSVLENFSKGKFSAAAIPRSLSGSKDIKITWLSNDCLVLPGFVLLNKV